MEENAEPGFKFTKKKVVSLVVIIFLLAAIPLGVFLVQKTQIFKSRAAEQSDQIGKLNQDILQANQDYRKAEATRGEDREVKLTAMISLASRRKYELLKEINTSPASFLKHSLSAEDRNTFPKEIQGYLEKNVEAQGKLKVIATDDFENKKSGILYQLEIKEQKVLGEASSSALEKTQQASSSSLRIIQNKQDEIISQGRPNIAQTAYDLHFVENPGNILSGAIVKVKGVVLDQEMVLTDNNQTFQIITQGLGQYTTGEQKTAVFMVNFLNDPSQTYYTKDELKQLLFGTTNSLDSYYRETSFNKTWFTGDVFGWYTVPVDNTACNYWIWAQMADDAALAAGVNLNQYIRRIYVFSSTPNSCNAAGMGELGGNPTRTWIFHPQGSMYGKDLYVYTHEIGHNLGLQHASTYYCGSKSIDTTNLCRINEYGEVFDIMGYPSTYCGVSLPRFNVPHQLALGWLPISMAQDIKSNGTFTVNALSNQGGPMILKIPLKDSVYPDEYYYLSYRQATGLDTGLPDGVTRGINIHIWSGRPWVPTKLINMTPTDQPLDCRHFFSGSSLSDNQLFDDQLNGIKITQLSHNYQSATVKVEFTSPQTPTSNYFNNWRSLLVPANDLVPSGLVLSPEGFLLNIGHKWREPTQTDVFTSKVNSSGTISQWNQLNSLPQVFYNQAVTFSGSFVYLIGGTTNPYMSYPESSIFVSRIKTDGTLENWRQTTPLPKSLLRSSAVTRNGYLYVIGGYGTYSYQSEVYVAKINSDGNLGAWQTLNSLPQALADTAAVIYNNRLLVIGGEIAYNQYSDKVYSAAISQDGTLGQWSVVSTLPKGLSKTSVFIYKNYLFTLGGIQQGVSRQDNYVVIINQDGNMGTWSLSSPLPDATLNLSSAIDINSGYVYITGAYSGQQRFYSALLTVPRKVCAQVITYAKNPTTNECKTFSTPCDVPTGWTTVPSCSTVTKPTPTPNPTSWCTPCSADVIKDSSNEVNIFDTVRSSSCFNITSTSSNWESKCKLGDLNKDNKVDMTDLNCNKDMFRQKCQLSCTPCAVDIAGKKDARGNNIPDGWVTGWDFSQGIGCRGKKTGDKIWSTCKKMDINGNGTIDDSDWNTWIKCVPKVYNKQCQK